MKTIVQFSENILKPYINDEDNKFAANIAPVEEDATSASQGYAVGQQLILDGVLYDVTAAITAGDALVTTGAGANISAADDVTTQIAATNTELSSVKQALSDEVTTRAKLGAHNLFENNLTTTTIGGELTFTVNADKTVSVSGTPTTNRLVTFTGIKSVPKGKYILSGLKGTTANMQWNQLFFFKNDVYTDQSLMVASANDYSFDTSNFNDYDEIRITCGRAVNNIACSGIIYPMIRPATDTDPTYQPYAMTNQQLTDAVNLLKHKISIPTGQKVEVSWANTEIWALEIVGYRTNGNGYFDVIIFGYGSGTNVRIHGLNLLKGDSLVFISYDGSTTGKFFIVNNSDSTYSFDIISKGGSALEKLTFAEPVAVSGSETEGSTMKTVTAS